MGSKETRSIPKHACTGRLVIVALSAQPPGVNELCVCVCVYPSTSRGRLHRLRLRVDVSFSPFDIEYESQPRSDRHAN